MVGWDRVWKEGGQSQHRGKVLSASICLWRVLFSWDSRVPKLELASQHCTKQLQVTFSCILMAAGNKGIKAYVLPQYLQYLLEDDTQAGRGLSKDEQLLGRAHYISLCYMKFREVHWLGQHHYQGRVLFHPYLSISSSLVYCLESFHPLISMKPYPYLGTCKDNGDKRYQWPEGPVPNKGDAGWTLLPVILPVSTCLSGRIWLQQQDLYMCFPTPNISNWC